MVSPDRTQALFSLAAVGRSGESQHDRLRFPGLDPATRYRIRPLRIGAEPSGLVPPPWMRRALEQDGLLVPGAVLTEAGVAAPLIDPEQALLFDITAV